MTGVYLISTASEQEPKLRGGVQRKGRGGGRNLMPANKGRRTRRKKKIEVKEAQINPFPEQTNHAPYNSARCGELMEFEKSPTREIPRWVGSAGCRRSVFGIPTWTTHPPEPQSLKEPAEVASSVSHKVRSALHGIVSLLFLGHRISNRFSIGFRCLFFFL